jgi:hypothetical protein
MFTECNRIYTPEALEVIPFPGAAVGLPLAGYTLVQEFFGLEQVVLQ